MQKTFNRSDWVEDKADAAARVLLTGHDGADIIRRYYPFRAKVLTLTTSAYGVNAGDTFEFARTVMYPAMMPVECIAITEDKCVRRMYFRSGEVQLYEV